MTLNCCLVVIALSIQSSMPSLDAATVNALAASAAQAAGGDAKKATDIFTADVKARIGEFYPFAPALYSNDDLSILAVPPMALATTQLRERLRKFEPVGTIDLLPGVAITVSPLTVRAPKIVKIVVHRDGTMIQPMVSTLSPTVLQNAMGAKFDSSSGVLIYPIEAFRPGGLVTVTAVPETGDNIVIQVPGHVLKHLR